MRRFLAQRHTCMKFTDIIQPNKRYAENESELCILCVFLSTRTSSPTNVMQRTNLSCLCVFLSTSMNY